MGKLFGGSALTLQTRLSPQECCSRLTLAVDPEKPGFSLSGYAGSKPILGKIRCPSMRLQKRIYYGNTFRRVFYGTLVPSDGGTLVTGAFRMRLFDEWFTGLWILFICLLMVVTICSQDHHGSDKVILVAADLGLIAGAVALTKFGQWLGKRDEKTIAGFLMTTLEATERHH